MCVSWCDAGLIEFGDGGRGWEVLVEGVVYVYLWLIPVDVWQKPTQYCKAIILQLNINTFFKT